MAEQDPIARMLAKAGTQTPADVAVSVPMPMADILPENLIDVLEGLVDMTQRYIEVLEGYGNREAAANAQTYVEEAMRILCDGAPPPVEKSDG